MAQENIIELKNLDDHALDYWRFFLEDQKTNIIKADDFRFVFYADRELGDAQARSFTNGERGLTDAEWEKAKLSINQDRIDQIITDMFSDAIYEAVMIK
jgi:hypothetical protein